MSDGTATGAAEPADGPAAGAVDPADGTAARSTAGEQSAADAAGTGRQWSGTAVGVAVVAADLVLLALVVAGTAGVLDPVLARVGLPAVEFAVTVPGYIYVFAVLGALGYVFTALVEDYRKSAVELLHVNLRLPAALPLGAGLYLLIGQFLGDVPARAAAGVAFLAGLFVNLAYRRLGSLARRLLPAGRGVRSGGGAVDGVTDGGVTDDDGG